MDNRIRTNENCSIGLPRCDYVFSSTRSCFIAYGFEDSSFEVEMLQEILEAHGIEPVQAGNNVQPASHIFCKKICSKIITSQFCAVLLNNAKGHGIPNANVSMEYGLMLGFNKYVIPFQKADQVLPFNVAGLDTVKYENAADFKRKAKEAIEEAIRTTQQVHTTPKISSQLLDIFLLAKNELVCPLGSDGNQVMFELGNPLGFNLLHGFSGMNYKFFGDFMAITPQAVVWRILKLQAIIRERHLSLNKRLELEIAPHRDINLFRSILDQVEIWVVVTSFPDRDFVLDRLGGGEEWPSITVFSRDDIETELGEVGKELGILDLSNNPERARKADETK